MTNLIEQRLKIKEEFTYYLSKIAKSGRTSSESGDSLGESSVTSYLLFIEPEKLFDYNSEAWKSIASMYDITDPVKVEEIQQKLSADEVFCKRDRDDNKCFRSNAISHYKHFLYAKEFFTKEAEEIRKTISTETDYVKFKHLLEYFCAHLQYVVTNDKTISGYNEYLKPFIDSGTFKKAGQGYKGDNIQKQISNWEQLSVGRICISVYGSSYKGLATYLHWDSTPHNIIANWKGTSISTLQLLDYNDTTKEREPLNIKFSLEDLGLYDGKEPNDNVKVFFSEFVKLLKKGTKNLVVDESPKMDVVSEPLSFGSFHPRQIIYYGAPGTGKSHTIKKEEDEGKITCIRTTFHPDSDYATFVGCYKPHKCKGSDDLTYEFVEQAFLTAYRMAWQNPEEEIALVIEEINRGNCAQVFGDIFQLLDRDEDGWSTYPIKADTDICDYLEGLAISGYSETMVKRYGKGKAGYAYLALPPNMSILATMNTSDQSLFPIDSAFKRRWDWRYIPICQGRSEPKEGETQGELLNWTIETSAEKNGWWDFLLAINGIIESTTHSEDKELGFFFCKADENGVISADKFVNKVVFYLWTDVFKTYGFRSDIFNKDADGKEKLSFKDFFDRETGKPNKDTVKLFVENVMKHLPKEDAE